MHRGEVAAREQRIKAGLRMVPAADGFVYCAPGAVASMRMDGIAELLGEPRLAAERFQTAEGRMQNWDEFVGLFAPPFRDPDRAGVVRAGRGHAHDVRPGPDHRRPVRLPAAERARAAAAVPGPGGASLRLPGRPFRIDGTPSPDLRPAPAEPGCDTADVLADWLGGAPQVATQADVGRRLEGWG